MALLAAFRALGPLVFRAPGDTAAGAHGPAVGGAGLPVPLPSSLAGSLASIAHVQGLCSPSGCGARGTGSPRDDFNAMRECLEKLLGRGFRLYSGLARGRGKSGLLVYTEWGYLPLGQLCSCFRGQGCRGVLPPSRGRIGVALNPATKTVRSELLYTVEEQFPATVGLDYVVLAETGAGAWLQGGSVYPVTLGAERRTAILSVEDGVEPVNVLVSGGEDCRRWVLLLASPALLDNVPWSSMVIGKGMVEKLFKELVKAANAVFNGRLVDARMSKHRPGLEVIAPGWCSHEDRPRLPVLHVPPGTVFLVEVSKNDVEQLVKKGLGCCTDLGWGTVAAACCEGLESIC